MLRKKTSALENAVERLKSFGPVCSPKQLASVLGGQPYYFNVAAKNGTLDYDFYWSGRALKIYTESVIKKITAT